MIDYLIKTTCIYICALLFCYHVKFYVLVCYNANQCNAARALVHCQRYALKQMFNYYYCEPLTFAH